MARVGRDLRDRPFLITVPWAGLPNTKLGTGSCFLGSHPTQPQEIGHPQHVWATGTMVNLSPD